MSHSDTITKNVRNAKALLVTLFHAVECTEHQTCIVPAVGNFGIFACGKSKKIVDPTKLFKNVSKRVKTCLEFLKKYLAWKNTFLGHFWPFFVKFCIFSNIRCLKGGRKSAPNSKKISSIIFSVLYNYFFTFWKWLHEVKSIVSKTNFFTYHIQKLPNSPLCRETFYNSWSAFGVVLPEGGAWRFWTGLPYQCLITEVRTRITRKCVPAPVIRPLSAGNSFRTGTVSSQYPRQ